MIRREPFSRSLQIPSAAALLGLVLHYIAFYTLKTPLLIDQISEWMMARTPSRYAVAILSTLGPWAKPCASTGALAILGSCLFISRWLGFRRFVVSLAAAVLAGFLGYVTGYSSVIGALTFWLPAIAFITFAPTGIPRHSHPRRQFVAQSALMATGVVAVAAESFLRESILEKQATQPVDLFPYQPPLAYRNFGAGLVRSEITPVREFYGMSKDTVDPLIDPNTWHLKISLNGKLLRTLRFGELLGLSREYRYLTLRCISNTLNSDLMGTAQWCGIHLSQIIDRNSLPPEIIEAAFIGVEGHDDSLKLDYAFGTDSLLAIGMNGKTLSRTHGFPVRLLAPSYYGCRNVKWLGEIRFVSQPYYGTWQRLGYTKEPLIHICSHIDHLRRDGALLQFGGVSFAGTRGIQAVRVRANRSDWQPAHLEPTLSPYTWTRWIAQLQAQPDSLIEANAQDKTGAWQELTPASPFPTGPAGPTIVIART